MMNMKRKSERTKEKERTKSEKAEEQDGGQEGSGFYRHCINFVQLESDMNHDMKEFFLARLECHISLGHGQANKNRTGDCGRECYFLQA